MIKDNIKFAGQYFGCNRDFEEVFKVLKTLGPDTSSGRIEINENAWINVNKNPVEQGENFVFEAHRDFIDIHYIISGEEEIVCNLCDDLKVTKEYNKDEDYMLLDGKGDVLNLKNGDFAVVFPQDAHAPAAKIKSENHSRAVAKIRINN